MSEYIDNDKSVGTILKEAREAKHFTIEDVAMATSFRVDSLQKIEADDYSGFNGDIYIKGTIRGYGNFLGFDGVELVKKYKKQFGNANPVPKPSSTNTKQLAESDRIKTLLKQEPCVGTKKTYAKEEKKHFPFGKFILGLLACGIATVIYFNMSSLVQIFGSIESIKSDATEVIVAQENKTNGFVDKVKGMYETVVNLVGETHVSENKPQQAKVEKSPAAVKETPKPAVTKTVEARYDKVVVEMTATGQCWIDVFADGKAIYSGMMTKGRYKIFEANKRITVKYGNISVIQVIVNGRPVNMKGEAGVTTKHYTR